MGFQKIYDRKNPDGIPPVPQNLGWCGILKPGPKQQNLHDLSLGHNYRGANF